MLCPSLTFNAFFYVFLARSIAKLFFIYFTEDRFFKQVHGSPIKSTLVRCDKLLDLIFKLLLESCTIYYKACASAIRLKVLIMSNLDIAMRNHLWPAVRLRQYFS